jgi:hypothetical protein
VLQDHGFGGNYNRFGGGGILERIASRTNCFPPFLLIAEDTIPWTGYVRVPDVEGSVGGMHRTIRFLYQRKTDAGPGASSAASVDR